MKRARIKKKHVSVLPVDPQESAEAADLRYVEDDGSVPGIRRIACGRGFRYVRDGGADRSATIKDAATLKRIASLVIPPAWKDVWICPRADGHIQATGRDARGRKQYRYHPRFRQIRDETKYERMLAFAEALPRIRAKVDEDLSEPGLTRAKVLATVVRLLEITLIRVGNEEYARENASFGLTTLRSRHVDVTGSNIRFRFRGKSGKEHVLEVQDRRVARVVARCTDLPGQILFQYVDDEGNRCTVEASEVNDYLRSITSADFTAKDFRTWAGTVLAARALSAVTSEAAIDAGEVSATQMKKNVALAIKSVASRLGNTSTVCRKCYVHPEIVTAYLDGELTVLSAPPSIRTASGERPPELSAHECAVLALLHSRLVRKKKNKNANETEKAAA